MNQALDEARHDLQHQTLRIAYPALVPYYGLLAAAHSAFLVGEQRTWMMGLAGGTMVAFAALTAIRDTELLRRNVDWGALALALLVTANCGVHLATTGEAFQTTNLLLTVVGAGILITSTPVFALTLGLAAASFALTTQLHPGDPLWPHFAFALFGADMLAVITYLIRRTSLVKRVAAEQDRDHAELERHLRAAAALAHESRYGVVVALSPAAIVVHRDGEVLFANQAASRLIRAGDVTMLVGMRLYDLFPPEDEERLSAWNEAAIAGTSAEPSIKTRLRALQGPWPYVELAATLITWEDDPAAILVATDVTATHALEQIQAQLVTVVQKSIRTRINDASTAVANGAQEEALQHLTQAVKTLDQMPALEGVPDGSAAANPSQV